MAKASIVIASDDKVFRQYGNSKQRIRDYYKMLDNITYKEFKQMWPHGTFEDYKTLRIEQHINNEMKVTRPYEARRGDGILRSIARQIKDQIDMDKIKEKVAEKLNTAEIVDNIVNSVERSYDDLAVEVAEYIQNEVEEKVASQLMEDIVDEVASSINIDEVVEEIL